MKNVIITILVILVLGLGGFIIYDKVIKTPKNVEENSNNTEVIEEKNYDLSKANQLIEKYYTTEFIIMNDYIFNTGLTDTYKLGLAWENLKYSDVKEMSCDYIDKNRTNGNFRVYCDENEQTVSYSTLNKVYKSLFGNNKDLKKEQVWIFDYIADADLFVKLSYPGGGGFSNILMYKAKEAKVKGNELTVLVAYYDLKPTSDWSGYYCDLNYKTYSNDEVNKPTFKSDFMNENLNEIQDVYEFKFIYEDEAYKLQSVKKISGMMN